MNDDLALMTRMAAYTGMTQLPSVLSRRLSYLQSGRAAWFSRAGLRHADAHFGRNLAQAGGQPLETFRLYTDQRDEIIRLTYGAETNAATTWDNRSGVFHLGTSRAQRLALKETLTQWVGAVLYFRFRIDPQKLTEN